MDKISAALIFGIISLVVISGIVIFDTWIEGEQTLNESKTVTENIPINEEISFNDDTSLTNCTNKCLWLRVKVSYDKEYNEGEYEIISDAVDNGNWELDEDGWYYYNDSLNFAQSTRPLIDRLLYKEQDVLRGASGKFSLRVEAVDESMLLQKPRNGLEAFDIFRAVNQT